MRVALRIVLAASFLAFAGMAAYALHLASSLGIL